MATTGTLITKDKIVFSDLNLSYDSRSDQHNDMVINEVSLNNAIITILSTRRGSRVFRRNFGSNILDLLFEPLDDITARRISTEIMSAIGNYETRIVLTGVLVLPDYDNQQYYVELDYIIPLLNNKQVSFNFNLEQART